MKKILSLLGTIILTGTSTTSLISCEKPNNSENGEGNKPEPSYNPQQPPENNNWKLVNDYNSFVFNIDNKFYFFVFQPFNGKQWKILKFKHDTDFAKEIDGIPFIPSDIKVYAEASKLKGLYRWDGNGEPQIPAINKTIGEITDWKG
ncbi:lipoprotein [Spiroplasma endosymbiont of Polydrusus cervinus]|uniref:lipoprotein n=1 Tax=Spiroplasma endosymbiont of Polydrusus cervinus TaxID=3066287 RepID=UPI0030CB2869